MNGSRLPRELVSLKDCLFDAFANSETASPQDPRQKWAIREALRRVNLNHRILDANDARKDFTCVRGCEIRKGDLYFREAGRNFLLCAGCGAMIFFLLRADEFQPLVYSHWHAVHSKPLSPAEVDASDY